MKSLLCMAISGAAAAAGAQSPGNAAAVPPVVEVRTGSSSPVATGASENFTGIARISSPFRRCHLKLPGATVSFEAGARTAWHTHPLGRRSSSRPAWAWCSSKGNLLWPSIQATLSRFPPTCATGMVRAPIVR